MKNNVGFVSCSKLATRLTISFSLFLSLLLFNQNRYKSIKKFLTIKQWLTLTNFVNKIAYQFLWITLKLKTLRPKTGYHHQLALS